MRALIRRAALYAAVAMIGLNGLISRARGVETGAGDVVIDLGTLTLTMDPTEEAYEFLTYGDDCRGLLQLSDADLLALIAARSVPDLARFCRLGEGESCRSYDLLFAPGDGVLVDSEAEGFCRYSPRLPHLKGQDLLTPCQRFRAVPFPTASEHDCG